MNSAADISVNRRANELVDRLKADSAALKIGVSRGSLGETLIDAGHTWPGSIAAGLGIAEICMGGLGKVDLLPSEVTPNWPWTVVVRSQNPVIACLGSQYAGWKLSDGEGHDAYFALGSGPARALARKEALLVEIGYQDRADRGVLVLESDRSPPAALIAKIAQDCGLRPDQLTFIYSPTQSLAGGTQVVARVLEVALHKAHALKFPLDRIAEGVGAAPLCPPHPDFTTAMGRTNDAIIFAGRVQLFVSGAPSDACELAERLPSSTSRDYGEPFGELFKRFEGDFYAIDPMLFSPAQVIVTAIESGKSFHRGQVATGLLDASFG